MTRGRTGTSAAAVTDSVRIASVLTFAVFAAASSTVVAPDPPSDAAHPAKMTVVHIPTHGLLINGLVHQNGLVYQPSGAGLHPTVVICCALFGRIVRWHRHP
jgi:hypothetical protein